MTPDARLRAAVFGSASAALEGLVPAGGYHQPERLYTHLATAPIRRHPAAAAEQIDELVFGEAFDALVDQAGFVFGQAVRDGYVGWTLRSGLGPPLGEATHRVAAVSAIALSEPNVRSPRLLTLPLNALLSIEGETDRFAALSGGGWTPLRHLQPIGLFEEDPADVALRHLGAPYLWGGRTLAGVDCSGLIQAAFYACGRACPRDSDQQQALGVVTTPSQARRNDLVFWPGHVGLMVDERRLLHANAYAMSVALEPLDEATARIAEAGGGQPTVIRP